MGMKMEGKKRIWNFGETVPLNGASAAENQDCCLNFVYDIIYSEKKFG